jgi:hypothetical protein
MRDRGDMFAGSMPFSGPHGVDPPASPDVRQIRQSRQLCIGYDDDALFAEDLHHLVTKNSTYETEPGK